MWKNARPTRFANKLDGALYYHEVRSGSKSMVQILYMALA